jgi:hypothetical protein
MVEDHTVSAILLSPRTAAHNTASDGAFMANEQVGEWPSMTIEAASLPNTFRDALLFEFDIAQRQLLGLANAIPVEKYGWRPDDKTRSVSEVLVHVAGGTFFLLQLAGHTLPPDIYGHITAKGQDAWWAIAKHNDELEQTLTNKDAVLELLKRSLGSAREAIIQTDEAALAEPLTRRAYMRLIAHTHEHMGQIIAYSKMNGLQVPWPDWRPDRRTS